MKPKQQYFSVTYTRAGWEMNTLLIRPYRQRPITHKGAARILTQEARENWPELEHRESDFTILRIESGIYGN